MTLSTLEKRITYWKKKLELHAWEFQIEVVEAPDGKPQSNACVTPATDYESAVIQFKDEWIENEDKEIIDRGIVHELLHVLDHERVLAEHFVCDRLSPSVESMYHERLEHEEEWFIEKIARIIVELDKS